MAKTILPDGYLGVSDALGRLARAMWAGVSRSAPVETAKRKEPRLRLRYGPWQDQAGQLLRGAALRGEFSIYVISNGRGQRKKEASSGTSEFVRVPPDVIKRLITSRGRFSDHAIRPSLRTTGGDRKLFLALSDGRLVLRATEFGAWRRRERSRGKWPSQESKKGPRVGRPTRQTHGLQSAIMALVQEREWCARDGFAKLHRLLIDTGRYGVPSQDTLTRLVTRMHVETGDLALSRNRRARRKSR